MRLLKATIYGMILTVSMLVVLIMLIGYSNVGLKWTLQLVSFIMPGTCHVEKVEGHLFDHLSLRDIHYKTNQQIVFIKKIDLNWSPITFLFKRELDIHSIDIQTLHISNLSDNISSAVSFDRSIMKKISHLHIKSAWISDLVITNGDHIRFNLPRFNLHRSDNGIVDFMLSIYKGDIRGQYRLSMKPSLSFDAIVIAQSIDLSTATSKLDEPVIVDIMSHIQWNDANQDISLQFKNIHGMLNHHPLHGSAHARYHNGSLNIFDTNLSMANSSLTLVGQLDQMWNMRWIITLPELHQLASSVRGHITSTGLITGTRKKPIIKANFRGSLKGGVTITGDFSHPAWIGHVSVMDMAFTLPLLGLKIDQLGLQGTILSNNRMTFEGKFYSKTKPAYVNGMIDFTQPKLVVALKGDNLPTVNLSEYKITTSPNVTFSLDKEGMLLEGLLSIPQAEITPKDLQTVVTLPDEVIIIDKNDRNKTWPLKLHMKLKMIFGQEVHVTYKGLSANLNGSLLMNQNTERFPVAVGELQFINGTYRAYGALLKLTNSRLTYVGGLLSNPGLNINAMKKIKTVSINSDNNHFNQHTGLQSTYLGEKDITIGVHVTGTADSPHVDLYSIPTGLNQGDILSYLLLGRPKSEASGQQVGLIMNLLSTINLDGQSNLQSMSHQLDTLLSFADFSIDSTDVFNSTTSGVTTTTTVGVGKQLLDNLYIHYSMGLFDPVSILKLRYKINKRLSIQSESSTIENGIDLLYGLEK